MLNHYNDLVLKCMAQDVAERYRREVESERLARQARSVAPKRAARKRGNLFTALGRRWGHTAPA